MNYKLPLAAVLAVVLSACGGGEDSYRQQIITEEGLIVPMVTSVSPNTATRGVVVAFTASGTDMQNGMKFSLADCDGITELAGGTAKSRTFTCTPGGALGVHMGNIAPYAGSTSTLIVFEVNFH